MICDCSIENWHPGILISYVPAMLIGWIRHQVDLVGLMVVVVVLHTVPTHVLQLGHVL